MTCPLLLMETGPALRVKDTPLLETFMLVFLSSFLVLRKLNPTVVLFLKFYCCWVQTLAGYRVFAIVFIICFVVFDYVVNVESIHRFLREDECFQLLLFADSEGFEPPEVLPSLAFETSALGRSANYP